jgi:hypothetical protein
LIVVQQRDLERRQPLGNPVTLAGEIFANDLDHPVDTKLILLRETSAHLLAKPKRQQRDRDEHNRGKGEEQAGTQAHHSSTGVYPLEEYQYRVLSERDLPAATTERPVVIWEETFH